MNPLTNMKNVTKLSERELQNNSKSSWHDQYRDSAWIFIGGLPYDLTEGDIICIFSQYGEVVNINLIRDKDTGKSKGYCFLCYEDQRSTVLTVDNLNGIKVLNRILRVDHVSEYKIPKEGKKTDKETKKLYNEGCAPKPIKPCVKNSLLDDIEYRRETLADQIQADIKLPARLPIYIVKKEEELINGKTEKMDREKLKNHSDSDNEEKTSAVDKFKQKKRHSRKKYSTSESDPDSEKETSKRQRSFVRNGTISDKNEKDRKRSRSPIEKRNRQFKEYEKTKKSSSDDRNEYRNSSKQSDLRKYDKHGRKSRS